MSVENRLIKSRLLEQEDVISRGYIDCGKALMVIRDERLYRLEHKSFESYVKERWEFTKSRANQLIEATTIVVALPVADRPKNEAQARELAKVPESLRAEVMAEVKKVAASEAREVTAKDIKSYVAEPKLETLTNATTDGLEYSDVEDNDDDETLDSEPKGKPLAIENGKLISELVNVVNKLRRDLAAIKEDPGLELVYSSQRSIDRLLADVKAALVVTVPHAICPRCNGRRCVQCENMGWVNSNLFRELTT